jgi:hypothetical protein
MDINEVFRTIVRNQCISAIQSIELRFSCDGVTHAIRGTSKAIVQIGGPKTVIFLSKDSTPQKHTLGNNAERNFNEALNLLLEKGSSFYTVLRPNWALPAFLWEKVQ